MQTSQLTGRILMISKLHRDNNKVLIKIAKQNKIKNHKVSL